MDLIRATKKMVQNKLMKGSGKIEKLKDLSNIRTTASKKKVII